MRKGDEKKLDILQTAERMFCQKGYRETSVQDILDALHTSKGSFYHHFESKDQVLETLCTIRAKKSADLCREQLMTRQDPMERLNAVIRCMTPIRRDESVFLAMLLPQLFTREGRALCTAYQDALAESFREIMGKALDDAVQAGVLLPPGKGEVTDIVMELINHCWLLTAEKILDTIDGAHRPDPSALADLLNRYRSVLERLLDAPHGSIEIVKLDEWYDVAKLVELRINLPA